MRHNAVSQKKVANAIFRKMKEETSTTDRVQVKRETTMYTEDVTMSTNEFICGYLLDKACKLVSIYSEIYGNPYVGWYAESNGQNGVRVRIYIGRDHDHEF